MSDENMIGKTMSHFTFVKKLGEGAWATVYQGVCDKDKKVVAIKVIPQKLLQSHKKLQELVNTEISVLKSCRNQNVIGFADTFKSKSSIFIAMEYCNGGDLEQYLAKKKTLPEDEATIFLQQILTGFKGLHEVGAMHRDFKTANVLLHNGICKIADLGFAKQVSVKEGMEKQLAGTVLGTSLTMAPEVLGEKPYSFKADIWSIGVVYYQMLFGKYPYVARNDYDLLKKLKTTLPDYTGKKISPNAKDFIERCLTTDPAKRIDWKDIYDHPLLKEDETQLLYGARDKNLKMSIMVNKDFYLKTKLGEEKKVREQVEIPFQEAKEANNPKNMNKIMEEVNGKQTEEKIFQKYLKTYRKRRNDLMFVQKFIAPSVEELPKAKLKHEIALFLMYKKSFMDLKKFKIDVDDRKNIFNFKDQFKEFTYSPEYSEISRQITADLEKTYTLAKSYVENVGLCSNEIMAQLNVNKVSCKNYNALVEEIANDYWNLLAQYIGSVKEKQKQALIKALQSLYYYKSNSQPEAEEFDEIMANIDFAEAEKYIISKYSKAIK